MKNFYLHRDGENHGPYPESQLLEMLTSGQIHSEELICEEGAGDWIPASTLTPRAAPPNLLTAAPNLQPAGSIVSGAMAPPPKKGMHGCVKMLLAGLAVVIVISIIGYFFWVKDNKLREHGVAQIEAMNLPEKDQLIYLAIANHYHLRAANSGERSTKRSARNTDENAYWTSLKAYIEKDIAGMPDSPRYDQITGNTYLWIDGDARYKVTFKKDGTYEKNLYWGKKQKDPSETENGKWLADVSGFQWKPRNEAASTQEILTMGREGFVLKIDSKSAVYWKRTSQ